MPGIPDSQAANDRKLLKDIQLSSDDVGILGHRDVPNTRAVRPQHQSLQIHVHADGIGRTKIPVHGDDTPNAAPKKSKLRITAAARLARTLCPPI